MKQNDAITAERVKILYGRSFASISMAMVGAIIFSYIFREQIASPVLLIWLAFMSIVALFRYWLLFDYNQNNQNIPCHEKFENRFVYATALVGLGWAFFILMGLNLPVFEYRIYSLLILVSIVALSVPIFSPSIRTIYFYISPSIIVSIPLLLSRGGDDTVLGIALIIFTAMVVRVSKDTYKTLSDTLVLRFQTQEQAKKLKVLQTEKSATEQRMQAIMDNSPAVIYAKDINGRYIFINQKWEELFDQKKSGIIGKTDHDVFPKEFADEFVKNDSTVLTSKHSLESEESAPHEDGTHTYYTVKFPLFDDNNNPYAICGISTDITKRKKMEDDIHSSEQHLQLYRDQAPMATIEWNTDFQVLDWNKAAEKMFGYSVEEIKGRNFVDFMLPDSAIVDVKQIWESLMAQTGGELSINENITKDGRTILCEWHNTPLKNEFGEVIGAASIVQDVTERNQQEEQLRRSLKMDALGKLTGGIAHDYNNMLGVIVGYSELLQEKLQDQPKLKKYTQQIHHAAERGVNLTEKLLSFTRHKSSNEKNMNINSLLQYEKDMLEKTLTVRIRLVYDLSEDLWPVRLDNNELEDVIINLSINAMHAMDGSGQLTIQTQNAFINETNAQLLQIKPGDYISLNFIDTGCGMNEETKDKMFDPFFSTKGEKGTGLGLSQVYGFVQRSHGAIKVRSELNHGTQITLFFPKHNKDESETNLLRNNNENNLSGNEVILVVDDEISLLDLTTEILTEQGYHVICASSGKQALEVLEKKQVDLLLSDVIMPGIDGYQLAQIVKEKFPSIKIQLASGFTDDRHIDMVNDTLHKNLLYKPYSSQDLLQKIRNLLDNT